MKKSSYHCLAKAMLVHLGNGSPSSIHIKNMINLLVNVFIDNQMVTSKRLSKTETYCLLLAAHGNTSEESANILKIGKSTVETHRKEARRKLGCSSMAQAVYQGIRYGYVKNK